MPAIKTAISLPADVFRRAEVEARNMQMSRSQLVTCAMEAYFRRLDDERITERLNEVYAVPLTCEEEADLQDIAALHAETIDDETW